MENIVFPQIKYRKNKMRTKNLFVSFLAIASILFLVSTVSAAEVTNNLDVTLDGLDVLEGDQVGVTAGELITLKAYFTSGVSASDIKFKAELEGEKVDVKAMSEPFDLEEGVQHREVLTIRVPYELKDEKSDDLRLYLKLYNKEHQTERTIDLRVQRPSYNVDIMSIDTSSTIEAGDTLSVDVVLKNIGYNDLDDLYVTAKISALGVEKTSYFGDLVSIECEDEDVCNEDDEDTVKGRFFLKVPYDASTGVYALDVEVVNDDTIVTETKQIAVKNDLASNVITSITGKTAAVGQNTEYSLLIVNPTNKLKVYRVIPESSGSLSVTVSESVIAISAGSSRIITVNAKADAQGEHNFNVNVLSGDELVNQASLSLTANKGAVANPMVVLTIVLAIVFLVLLIVLFVLLGKKPKTEEFGESYY